MAKTLSFLLRDIDPAMWAKVKRRAAATSPKLSIHTVILALLELYAAGAIDVSVTSIVKQRQT